MPEAKKLTSLSDIFRFFRELETPIYFISGTPFNILGLGQLVPSLRYINYFDCFDGHHYRVFTPLDKGQPEFASMEDVVNFLLQHQEVEKEIGSNAQPGLMLTVMFDEQTQALAKALNLQVALPAAELRKRLDSKIVTTRIGNEAGVASVPNVLGTAASYAELVTLAQSAGLGEDLVVQTPYGDSGRTTFFIKNEQDWDKYQEQIVGEQLKVMKRIDNLSGTVEGVATRHGTLVGPVMMEVVGHSELTPYKGGWSGNEAAPQLIDEAQRDKVIAMVQALGDRLYEEGYRGTFCMDFLLDIDSDEVYLGELNPRISGASPLTNLITQKYSGVPLLFFHLLEFLEVDWEIDLQRVQERWLDYDSWSTLVLKNTEDKVEIVTSAPASGIWRVGQEEQIDFLRRSWDWSNAAAENDAFFLRILGAGEYLYKGADLGILLTRGRVQLEDGRLTARALAWNKAIKSHYRTTPPAPDLKLPQTDGLLYKIQ
jgi:biotin carboxylase